MDLGTGTGIWAINVAEEYVCLDELSKATATDMESRYFPDGRIMAVDLNQIQPALLVSLTFASFTSGRRAHCTESPSA